MRTTTTRPKSKYRYIDIKKARGGERVGVLLRQPPGGTHVFQKGHTVEALEPFSFSRQGKAFRLTTTWTWYCVYIQHLTAYKQKIRENTRNFSVRIVARGL